MILLGISDSHEAHACLLRDGKLLALMAEERLSRLKADMGYPTRSIDALLAMTGIRPEEIDMVAFAGAQGNHFQRLYKMNALFSVKEWIRQCREFWKPVLFEGKALSALDEFEQSRHVRSAVDLAHDPYCAFVERACKAPQSDWSRIGNTVRMEAVERHLNISRDRIRFFRHEDCHKYYGYDSWPQRGERALVFTIEGGGDDSSATVSIAEGGQIREVWKSNAVQLGRLYRYVTLILGMKPAQHEYKVMGLAPYGNEYHGRRSLEFFRTINKVVGTEIANTQTIPDLYFSVRDALEGERFDGIAWGLQTYLEEVLCEWVVSNVEHHGIDSVILSGGVAQNIKACQKMMALPSVRQFWVGPIAGDGSLAVGAAWLAHRQLNASIPVQGLPTVYLGTQWSRDAIDEALARHDLFTGATRVDAPSHDLIAQWLDGGLVIARFSGRMEFGQRALGNRSILADPRTPKSVERINNKIKFRDFWMPFTPSMLYEEAERFLLNPKQMYSPFMTMAFDLKPEYEETLPAVIHPADKTVRPQMLKREDNPSYYDLIAAFKRRTGMGVVLNTSFNLHGDAIVESPDDAIQTFLKSDLDVLLFDHVAVVRNGRLLDTNALNQKDVCVASP